MGLRNSSLEIWNKKLSATLPSHRVIEVYLLLGVCPARNLDNHVKNVLLLIGIQRNIVERRDRDTILLDVHTVLESVGGADFADGVRHGGVDRIRRQSGCGSGEMSCQLGSTIDGCRLNSRRRGI